MKSFILYIGVTWAAIGTAGAATFGRVVPIGGHASDIALDQRRGVLYVANFTASRIEVMSLADNSLKPPIGVPPQPGSLALSPDGRYLVVTQYDNRPATATVTAQNGVTILDLDGGVRQTLPLGAPPLAVAFGGGDRCLLVTTKEYLLLDPVSATLKQLRLADLQGKPLTVPLVTFPPEIVQASTGVSGDGRVVYVLAEAGGPSAVIRYLAGTEDLRVVGITASPPLGPRSISVDRDGSTVLAGWGLTNNDFVLLAQFPYPTGKFNLGSHVFDYTHNLIYGHIPVGNVPSTAPPATPPAGSPPTPTPSPTAPAEAAVLTIFESDNLTVRERLNLPENLAGRSILSPDAQVVYAISDSGIMVLPMGALNQAPRLATVQEDLVFRGNACDRRTLTQFLDVVDPGGGQTAFRLSTTARGVRIGPASGTTPARVRIDVDPELYLNQKGTVAATLEVTSEAAVNIPSTVRLLINTREPEQRGALLNVPGKLVDILPDPARDRIYVLRQDKNLLLVFRGSSLSELARLRTGNTPVQMAMTADNRYLIVTNDNSQMANVYDLDTLQPSRIIAFQPGEYPRSIAVSHRAILATSRSVSGAHKIHRIDFANRIATPLESLGIYTNAISADTMLVATPSLSFILGAQPEGGVLLYESGVDTFVASRKDLSGLSGALAALSDEMYLIDNNFLNRSLVPMGKLPTTTGSSSGFAFIDGLGLRTTSLSISGPGVIQWVDFSTGDSIRPTRLIESPVLAKELSTTTRVGQIGQTILPFSRTLAPLANRSAIVSLTASGLTTVTWNFGEALAAPRIDEVVNSADFSEGVAPGGLITIRGSDLSPTSAVNREMPVPSTLGEACLTVNGTLIPILVASPGEIQAQMPFSIVGNARMVLRAPGGTSNTHDVLVSPAAPALFWNGTAGDQTGLPTIYRAENQELATPSNPLHPGDQVVIFATGLGQTSPEIEAGAAAPGDPPSHAVIVPTVTLGGVAMPLIYAGLMPGQVGIYQINVLVPDSPQTGTEVPLEIKQGGRSITLPVRVVDP